MYKIMILTYNIKLGSCTEIPSNKRNLLSSSGYQNTRENDFLSKTNLFESKILLTNKMVFYLDALQ